MRINLKINILILACYGIAVSGVIAAPQLELDTVTGAPGQLVEIPLRLTGAAANYAGFNATIHLPVGVQYETVIRGAALPSGNFFLAASPLTSATANRVTVLGYSATQTFNANGVLCWLRVRIGTGVQPGSYPLILDAPDESAIIRRSHALASADGTQSISHTVEDGELVLSFGDAATALGTPYWWLSAHNLAVGGLSFEQAERIDHDDDGYESWQEYIADTDPTNNASFLHVFAIEKGPPVIARFEPASIGRVYQLEQSPDLTGTNWITVTGPQPGSGGPGSLTAPTPSPPAAHYRIDVRLP